MRRNQQFQRLWLESQAGGRSSQMFSLTSDRRTQTRAPHTHAHEPAQTLRCSKQRKLRPTHFSRKVQEDAAGRADTSGDAQLCAGRAEQRSPARSCGLLRGAPAGSPPA